MKLTGRLGVRVGTLGTTGAATAAPAGAAAPYTVLRLP